MNGGQQETKVNLQRLLPVAFAAGLVSIVLVACGGNDAPPVPPVSGTTLKTLSNRADLISGGSALVEVKVPGFVQPPALRIDRDGTDITAAFKTLPSGRIVGLVTG